MDCHGTAMRADILRQSYIAENNLDPLCRHSEALAGYVVRDKRIAELERLSVAISSDCNDMANERNQLRAELSAIKAQVPVAFVHADSA